MAGIVHFSWFFRYMEEAEHALWREAGLTIESLDSRIAYPRVAASFDFHRVLRYQDEFDVHLRVVGISRRSITYACVLKQGAVRIATGSLTVACAYRDPHHQWTSTDIPPEVAAGLQVADAEP